MSLDSIDRVIHNKKVAKKKTNDQSSNVQMYNSTIGKGSTHDSNVNSTNDTNDEGSQAFKKDHRQKRKDIEIDQYIMRLVHEGLVPHGYRRYHCKAIYTIGLERYHMIILDIRHAVECGKNGSGKPINNPGALLSYKVKGTLQLHAKEQWQREA